MKSMSDENMIIFYSNHIKEVLLPFWDKNGIDYEYGGYFTCFDNVDSTKTSTDKFTWSQGRMVWIYSKLSEMKMLFESKKRDKYLSLAKQGVEFIIKHCILPNGNCTFLTSQNGTPKYYEGCHVYDSSIYVDCFVILGISRYAMASKDKKCLDFCKTLYQSVIDRISKGTFRSDPYPIPNGYRAHGIPMIMLNVSTEFANALKIFGDEAYAYTDKMAQTFMEEILNDFLDDDFVLREMIPIGTALSDDLFYRYINPGHTLEDLWFILHYAIDKGREDIIKIVAKATQRALEAGWDAEYGGLFLFADRDGGKPQGRQYHAKHPMAVKVLHDWNNKLWWPHSEALYTTLWVYYLTKDEVFLKWHHKLHDYTFRTFPNPNQSVGEWIQIRDRFGKPETKTVALPVKDPFHIIRNLLLIIELLHQNGGGSE